MYDYYDEPPYYEPTIADEILIEYQQKMKEALLESIKLEIENMKNENEKLKEENKKLRLKSIEIDNKERDLKYKEENIKKEVTEEFYKSNIGDTLKQYMENCELWFAGDERYQNEKCELCNENRELVAKFPNGEFAKIKCACSNFFSRYIPALSEITLIKFSKKDSKYTSDRKFYLDKTYSARRDRSYYNYDHDYQEFNIYHIIDEFNEGIVELHENKSYSEKLGFKNKEECQKYCDWLNSKKD